MLSQAWATGVLPKPDLDELRSKAAALDETQSGPAPWRVALECLLTSLNEEAQLNPVGLAFAYVQLAGLLRHRQRALKLWRRQPDIPGVSVDRPVFILGQMRSGTTRLQRLLGCDPRLSHTRFHEVNNPVARSRIAGISKSWVELTLLHLLNPELRGIHPTSATAVEEAFGLLSFSFYGAQIEAQWRVPGFARHWEAEDRTWVYEELKKLVQTIAWRRGAKGGPWVLKAPQFMEDLEALLSTFPDSRLICVHRDPAAVVGSSASLVWNHMRIQSDAADRAWIGGEWLRKTARRASICSAVRTARSEVRQLDVAFEDMDHDWRSQIRRIYAFLEITLTREVEQRMETYLATAERSGFRTHSYRLEDFGLDAATVRKAVGPAGRYPI